MPGTIAACQACGYAWDTGVTFENVTIVGGDNQVALMGGDCPRCKAPINLGVGEGTYSTIGGRLRRIAGVLAKTEMTELEQLRQRLSRINAEHDAGKAEQALTELGVAAPREGWSSQANRKELWAFLGFLDGSARCHLGVALVWQFGIARRH